MSKEDIITVEGIVKDTIKDLYRVELENGHIVNAHVSGKIRMNYIRILPGDKVKLEISSYDITKGRIIYRVKK